MARAAILNSQNELEWTEKLKTSQSGQVLTDVILHEVDEGNGFTTDGRRVENVPWISYSVSSSDLNNGGEEITVKVKIRLEDASQKKAVKLKFLASGGRGIDSTFTALNLNQKLQRDQLSLIEHIGEVDQNAESTTSLSDSNSSIADGDFVLAAVATGDSSTSVTEPSWMSLVYSSEHRTNSSVNMRVFKGFFQGGNQSITFNFDQSDVASFQAQVFRNVDQSNPIIKSAFASSSDSNKTHSFPNLDQLPQQPGLAGIMCLNFCSTDSGNGEWQKSGAQPEGQYIWYNASGASAALHSAVYWNRADSTRLQSYDYFYDDERVTEQGVIVLSPASGSGYSANPNLSEHLFENLSEAAVGYSYELQKDGTVAESGGYGWERAPWTSSPTVQMSTDSVHTLDSLSKIITACGVLKLEEKSSISLEDEAYEYIKNRFPKRGEKVDKITIEDLLRMRGAIGERNGNEIDYTASNIETDFQDWLTGGSLLDSERERNEYQNGQFAFLQFLIEEVTGKSYVSWIQNNILNKTSAELSPVPPQNRTPQEEEILLYDQSGNASSAFNPTYEGVGGFYGSVSEFNKFLNSLQNGKIVSDSSFVKMKNLGFRLRDLHGEYGNYQHHTGAQIRSGEGADIIGTIHGDGHVSTVAINTDLDRSTFSDALTKGFDNQNSLTSAKFFLTNSNNNKCGSYKPGWSKKGRVFWDKGGNLRGITKKNDRLFISVRGRNQIMEVTSLGEVERKFPVPASETNDVYGLETYGNKLYWSSVAGGFVKRANINDGSNLETIVTTGSNEESGVFALDGSSSKIFYPVNNFSSGTHEVRRINFNGSGEQTLTAINNSVFSVEYYNGKVYYRDGNSPTVRRVNSDGTGDEEFYTFNNLSSSPNINGIRIDGNRLYVCATDNNVVQSVKMDGTGEQEELSLDTVRYIEID